MDYKYDSNILEENVNDERVIKHTVKAIKPTLNHEAINETVTAHNKNLKAIMPSKVLMPGDVRQDHNAKKLHKVLKVDPDFYKEFRFLEKSSESKRLPGDQVY